MKLHYTTGCICDSLTVDGEETINLGEKRMKEVVKEMVTYSWNPNNDFTSIVRFLVMVVGEEKRFMFGPTPVYNEIITYLYRKDEKNYLTYLDVPTEEILLICELVCTYSGTTRQERWDNKKHIIPENLDTVLGMIDMIEEFADLQWIFCKVMEMIGKPETPYHCGCCGDTVYSWNLKI